MTFEETLKQAVREAIEPLQHQVRELEAKVNANDLPMLLTAKDMQQILGKGAVTVSQLMQRPDFKDACVERELGTPYVVTERFIKWLNRNDMQVDFSNVRQLRRKGIG
jgi:hypothetical protein